MLGIEGTFVWLAYVLCIAASLLCIGYGLLRWNQDEGPAEEADQRWAEKEIKESEDL